MWWGAGLVVAAAVASSFGLWGCSDPDPVQEGGVCRVCKDGGGIVTSKCAAAAVLDCVAGTRCLDSSGTCERELEAGEPCDFRGCAAGLVCDVNDTCNAPAAAGQACGLDEHCTAGTVCVRGAEALTLGVCAPLDGAAGAACEWGPHFGDGSSWFSNGFGSRGCGGGLVCRPGPRPELTAAGLPDAPGLCRYGIEPTCGYAGVCETAGLGERGDPCLHDDACASGRCSITVPPRAVEGTSGFDCSDTDACFQGPWPGLCLGADDIGLDKSCSGLQGDPSGPQCGPLLICIDGFCRAWWTGFGEKCEPVYPDGTDVVPACPLGSSCSGSCSG